MGSDEPVESDSPTEAAPSQETTEPTSGRAGVAAPGAAQPETGSRYTHGSLIGRGGMGEVRVCADAHVGREVAFKTMRGRAEPLQQARFLREAKLQARLEHPSIVPVYEVGISPDGAPWFTMRRIGGTTLADVITRLRAGDPEAERQFTRRRILGDFVRIAQAVAYAHEQGVVHRDIKPANVILSDFGEVYLLDWGVAKVRGESGDGPRHATPASGDGVETEVGSVLGTIGYMPPEQLEDADVDVRADVYALGAILFELLTLEPLHPRGDTAKILQSTLTGADARASVRAPDRDVPPELEAVCVRATSSDPGDRHASVAELLTQVERYLDGDRDLQRRRELAQDHAARASAALGGGEVEPDLEARAIAAAEAGRALALDPTQSDALAVFTRLLVQPPRVVPASVQAELDAGDVEGSRGMARFGAYSRLVGLALLGLCVWMGVREWTVFWALASLLVFSSVSAALFAARGRARPLPAAVLVMNTMLVGLLATVFGPFVLVPGLCAATSAMFLLGGAVRPRSVAIAGCLPILVPWGLAQAGVIPASMTISDGMVMLHPVLAEFPPIATTILLLFGSVAVVLLTVLAVSGARARLRASRRHELLQAWHLSQLVPGPR